MLRPYPLESPPPLPPFDGEWKEGVVASSGRRARPEGEGWGFPGSGAVSSLVATGGVERRFVALEEPCLFWEVSGAGELTLSCLLDLGVTDLRYERGAEGDRIWIGSESSSREFLVGCLGGVLSLEGDGAVTRLVARGRDRVRMLIVGCTGEPDRDQVTRILARKGLRGLQEQQERHAAQVAALSVHLLTPPGAEDRQVAEGIRALDAALVDQGGRREASDLLATGAGLLAVGLREPVRDLLRAPFQTAAHLRLYGAYATWAGDDEFLRKRWPEAARALRQLHDDPVVAALAAELLPIAESVGDLSAIGMLDGLVARGAPALPPIAAPVAELLQRRWGVAPNALEGMVRLAPVLPAEWDRMTLERLRVGPTTLDVRIKRRPGGVACHCRVTHGPSLLVHLAPVLPFVAAGVLVGDEQFPGPELRFELEQEMDAVWLA